MISIHAVAASNVGNVRGNNEDNFFINGKTLQAVIPETVYISDESSRGLYAVCDGMGGEENGELASEIAVNTLREYYWKPFEKGTDLVENVNQYTEEANARICVEIEKNGGQRMGSTFSALYIRDGLAHAFNVGDSRVYMFRNNQLTQLSQDHTQVRGLVDMGIVSAEQARTHPGRHTLTQHLGIFPSEMVIEPYAARPLEIENGDVFLLCSDGLTDMLEDDEIANIMGQNPYPRGTAESLIAAALKNGGKDNVTVIAAKVKR